MDKHEELNWHRLLILVVGIIILEAILFSVGNFKLNSSALSEKLRGDKIQAELQNLPVEAKAVSVYDITRSKKIYARNDDTPMPLASLAKTMTVLIALDHHKLGDVVFIPMAAISQVGDYGLYGDERWYMSDLAKSTLIASANDGAFALTADNPNFVADMNAKGKRLGMENTIFLSPTGLDITSTGLPAQAGGFISAADANTMAMYALRAYPHIFDVTTMSEWKVVSLSNFTHVFKNTDELINKIPNLMFSKTGFTDLAGGNLTVIFKDSKDEEYAVTILGSTFEGRFTDMENIVNVLYSN